MLRGAGQNRDMLVADVAVGERRTRLGQLLELARDFDPLHGRPAREFALPAQPGRQREGAIGLVFARLVEATHTRGEGGLQRVNARLPDLDERLA